MTIVGAALLVASQVGSSDLPFDRVTPETAAQRVSACGLGKVTVKYDDLLQSEILLALSASADAVTDEKLSCADTAASYYDLQLPAALQLRYNAIREGRLKAYSLAKARSWLSERNLLEKVPHYQAGVTNDADFARVVEGICGLQAKGALHSQYGFHVISPEWVRRSLTPINKGGSETLACIMIVGQVAGDQLGLIGNEAT